MYTSPASLLNCVPAAWEPLRSGTGPQQSHLPATDHEPLSDGLEQSTLRIWLQPRPGLHIWCLSEPCWAHRKLRVSPSFSRVLLGYVTYENAVITL